MKKKILILIFVLLFSLLFVNGKNMVKAASIGTIKYTYSRTILKDMEYTYTESNNGSPQRAYVLQYNPKSTQVDCLAVFGEELFGGDKISHNIQLAKSQGYNVKFSENEVWNGFFNLLIYKNIEKLYGLGEITTKNYQRFDDEFYRENEEKSKVICSLYVMPFSGVRKLKPAI